VDLDFLKKWSWNVETGRKRWGWGWLAPFFALKLAVARQPHAENPPPAPPQRSPVLPDMTAAEDKSEASAEPPPDQLHYAGLLEKGVHIGLACLLLTFPLYVFGVVEPSIPLEKVPQCWVLDAPSYHREVGMETGWHWVSMLGYGDFINYLGITLLASVTLLCYLAIIPRMLKRRATIYALLALVQIVVLVVAASGILAAGH
jgi:hypothetical protein